jgi:FixJ family two-component response regulator
MKRLLLAVLLLLPVPAAAQHVSSDRGRITWISTGWVDDTMAVITQAPLANPGCPVTNAGYATNPADRGHQLHHSVLLAVFFSGKEAAPVVIITGHSSSSEIEEARTLGVLDVLEKPYILNALTPTLERLQPITANPERLR